jgi:hypothetical protein
MGSQTSKASNSARSNVLHVRVWSARLFCFGLLKFLFRFTKYACVLAVLGGIGLAIKLGIQRAFYDNPEFTLQVVDLNPNPAIDEIDFVKITGINLRANLFRIDINAITHSLAKVPQIADVHVERLLPSTLVVRVTARKPRAWIASPDAGIPATRNIGAMLVDYNNVAYPCSERQMASSAKLPIIVLPSRAKDPITLGDKIRHPELQRCLRLLTTVGEAEPESLAWIESIKQVNAWSLALTTRDGTVATFGLGDHLRQMSNLRAALKHADNKGYAIDTINLIPKENVPVTVSNGAAPPRAIPVAEPTPAASNRDRRPRDLKSPLKRE